MPDFALLWPVWLQRHHLYSGDTEFLEEVLPCLNRLFDYFEQLGAADGGVLSDLGVRRNAYCFLDHGSIDREGAVTGLNAIYCRSLISGAWLCQEAGHAERAHDLRRLAAAVAARIRELAWDEERSLFADSWHDGEMSEFYSWQTNVLAVYGGIALSEQYTRIFEQLFSEEEPYELFGEGETNNPYFKYFVLESAFALEHRDWAMNLIRWYWGAMLEQGATTWWELFDPSISEEESPSLSRCHGYGVSPNGFLFTELVGIRPQKPGFTAAYFNPMPEVVPWVKAQIPTPYGRILVEWQTGEDGQFEALVDANHPLDIVPVLAPGLAETATIHVTDNVSILAST